MSVVVVGFGCAEGRRSSTREEAARRRSLGPGLCFEMN